VVSIILSSSVWIAKFSVEFGQIGVMGENGSTYNHQFLDLGLS
jgi:hypothetical protein